MRATTSLPVPVSPVISTGTSLEATILTISMTRRMGGDSPTTVISSAFAATPMRKSTVVVAETATATFFATCGAKPERFVLTS